MTSNVEAVAPRQGPHRPFGSSLRRAGLAAAVGVALLVVFPGAASRHVLAASIVALMMCFLAQCWNLAAGYAGQLSLGHSVFFAVGGYTSTVLFSTLGLSPFIGAFVGAVLAALLGAAMSAVAFKFKVRGVFFAVITLGMVEIGRSLADQTEFLGGSTGISITMANEPLNLQFAARQSYFWLIALMVAGMYFITRGLEHSGLGQRLLALREDEDAAEASGIDTYRYKILAVSISAFFTAFAGTFYAQYLLFVSPETMFNFDRQLSMMLGTMVGGPGTALGPIVGSLLFSGLSEALSLLPFKDEQTAAAIGKLVYATVLILVILYLPGGIARLWNSARANPARERSGRHA